MAVKPPVAPMLARLARALPLEGFLYEPKWDGFRCLAFRDREQVDLRSRHDRPFSRYFPEIVEALLELPEERVVVDGELLIPSGEARFERLLGRLHPAASRVELLARESPAAYVAFDLLAVADEDLRERPFEERRHRLERVLAAPAEPIRLTPITDDPREAEGWLERFQGGGIDGIVAKPRDEPYQEGRRAMVKLKVERTAECVVAGYRPFVDHPAVASLLLGLYDRDGALHHAGVASSFRNDERERLRQELGPLEIPLEGHPWEHGWLQGGGSTGKLPGSAGRWTPDMEHDWVPLRPERVCEVAYDQMDGVRFRHPARFRRWRPDRDPRSCRLDQLEVERPPVEELLTR
jgi:ATP-dependent DNA ligase